jgi:hypothetical protein
MNTKKIILTAALTLMGFKALAMEAGTYLAPQEDGSQDVLVIRKNGTGILEETRQVGGPGGISKDETVPYPTVCRERLEITLLSERGDEVRYKVTGAHLAQRIMQPDQLTNDVNCNTYTNIYDGLAKTKNMQFTLQKSKFKKAK